jgi:copper/silver efflux system protein
MRSGENALATIRAVKARLAELQHSLPEGVEIVPTYDRSGLIERAVDNLRNKLIEELIVVALVCAVFLFHLRSSLVVVIFLPIGILAAFVIMRMQGINANIMSLGGIAIAIGAMVDAAIVMIENVHKHLERETPGDAATGRLIGGPAPRWGRRCSSSLLIITVSFLPVFTLEAQEGACSRRWPIPRPTPWPPPCRAFPSPRRGSCSSRPIGSSGDFPKSNTSWARSDGPRPPPIRRRCP